MKTLHITPGPSAGGSLRQALRGAGHDDEVFFYWDDLSCGPIDSDDAAARTAWWAEIFDGVEAEIEGARNRAFWERVATTDERLVVWVGRHSAMELAFFLAWCDRLGERPYNVVDVTGRRLAFKRPDGSRIETPPIPAVSIAPPDGLRSLFGSERQFTAQERVEARERWRRLKGENAPFRVVSPEGLVSAQADHFDPLLMERATTEWRSAARVIGDVLGYYSEPYHQVGDLMLLTRVVALIGEGKLLAEGDPWDMRSCRVRLPV